MEHQNPFEQRTRESVGALKTAIRLERGTLADYRERLKTGRGKYPAAGLEHGIERCLHNLEVMKAAIVDQREAVRAMNGQAKIQEHIDRIVSGERVEIEIEIEEG